MRCKDCGTDRDKVVDTIIKLGGGLNAMEKSSAVVVWVMEDDDAVAVRLRSMYGWDTSASWSSAKRRFNIALYANSLLCPRSGIKLPRKPLKKAHHSLACEMIQAAADW